MSQFVFTMTSRMVAIAATCAVLLCILLFLLGVQIGKLMIVPTVPTVPLAGASALATPAAATPSAPDPMSSSSSAVFSPP